MSIASPTPDPVPPHSPPARGPRPRRRPGAPHRADAVAPGRLARAPRHPGPRRCRATASALRHHHAAPARDLPAVVRPELVPTLSGDYVDYANLDHAASTPALERVARAVAEATRTYSSVHRGTGWLSRVTSAHYEAAREEVAPLRRRPAGRRRRLHPQHDRLGQPPRPRPAPRHLGRRVLLRAPRHAAAVEPPRHRPPAGPGPARDAEVLLEDALRALPRGTARRPRQALVVLSAASNVTGEIWPVERLTAVARRFGARVLLDAAQLAAHRTLDIAALDVDWVAFSGHKVHAPSAPACSPGAGTGSTPRAPTSPAAAPARGHRALDPLGHRPGPARGRQPQRPRRRRPGRRVRHHP